MASISPDSSPEALYRFLAERTSDVSWTTDLSGTIFYLSHQIGQLLEADSQTLVGRNIDTLIHDEDLAEARSLREALVVSGEPFSQTFRLKRVSSPVWIESTTFPLQDGSGKAIGFAGVWRDITERKRIEEAFEHQAYHDALTGLPNRLLFEDRLSIALASARRLGTFVAVLFIDLDRLKTINDTLGHGVGDEVLRTIAQRLRSCVRSADTLARVGGDEFTLVASNIRHEEDTVRIARVLLAKTNEPIVVSGRELFVRASIGIAIFPHDGQDAARLLAAADEAMYRCKNIGGNSWQLHHSFENERALERLGVEMDLHRALERNEFKVLYQPLVDVSSHKIIGVEALLRWQHATHGELSPAAFLDIAEETGLIVPIGERVLHMVCSQAREWLDQGWKDVNISMNLSARQFDQDNLIDVIEDALKRHRVSPEVLQLEITEGTALRNLQRSAEMLTRLRERRLRIAIDDFGIGYSSLAYLKGLPVHSLKIDRTFLAEYPATRDTAIITAVIAMGHALGLSVVAEGVERDEQVAFLREQRCDTFQGFLFSRPTTPAEIARLLNLG